MDYPENTLLAVKSAICLGVDWIEIDIRKTQDNEIVVIHDFDTGRVGDKYFKISQVKCHTLKTADVAYAFRENRSLTIAECPYASVPLLSDVIRLIIQQHKTRLSLQPKSDCVNEAISLVEELHAKEWIGFNDGSLYKMKQVKSYDISIPVFWDRQVDANIDDDVKVAKEEGFETVVIQHQGITQAKVDTVHHSQLMVGAWTVNEADDMKLLLQMGVDRIYTDDPRKLLQLRRG